MERSFSVIGADSGLSDAAKWKSFWRNMHDGVVDAHATGANFVNPAVDDLLIVS